MDENAISKRDFCIAHYRLDYSAQNKNCIEFLYVYDIIKLYVNLYKYHGNLRVDL